MFSIEFVTANFLTSYEAMIFTSSRGTSEIHASRAQIFSAFIATLTQEALSQLHTLVLAQFSRNVKSREFIVVPRNLLVKLNALEKQTEEKYLKI